MSTFFYNMKSLPMKQLFMKPLPMKQLFMKPLPMKQLPMKPLIILSLLVFHLHLKPSAQSIQIAHLNTALQKMGNYKVVGLGEGTHGTSEFQTVRSDIARYLVTKKGFNIICLENSYGWCVALNKYIRTGEGNIDTLMKENLLGMWQNQETKELLEWLKTYNQTHKRKVELTGMDYSCILPAAELIPSLQDPNTNELITELKTRCKELDNAYAHMDTYPRKDLFENGVKGYELIQQIKPLLPDSLALIIYNIESAFNSIYKPVKTQQEASRDEQMAGMVKRMATRDAKIIIFAHQAHLARKSIFDDDSNGGGSGSYLTHYFPQQYFALGTGTSGGTISVTKDRFILHTSRFSPCALPAAPDSSWEQSFAPNGNQFIDCTKIGNQSLKLRFTGYGPPSADDFVNVKLHDLFDGFIFIKTTHATHIRQ